jgi:hypothetical protein
LLAAAAGLGDGELCGSLHGLRCYGAGLSVGRTTWRLERGEIGAADYAAWRAQYLAPHAEALTGLLAGMAQGDRGLPGDIRQERDRYP